MADVNGLAAKIDALLQGVEALRAENVSLTKAVADVTADRDARLAQVNDLTEQLTAATSNTVDPTVLDSIDAKVQAELDALAAPGQ